MAVPGDLSSTVSTALLMSQLKQEPRSFQKEKQHEMLYIPKKSSDVFTYEWAVAER